MKDENIYYIEPDSEEELENEKEMMLKNAYASVVYSGISRAIDYEYRYGSEDKREQLEYMVNRYAEEHIVGAKYLQESLEIYSRMAEAKYGERNQEIMEQARFAYENHRTMEEDWLEGEPAYAWKDSEGFLIVEYVSGRRCQYIDLDTPHDGWDCGMP